MPQHNRVAERMNTILMEKVRRILSGARFTQQFWVEEVDKTCNMVKISMFMVLVNKIPYETWDSKNPCFTHVRVFGCDFFDHILKEKMI